MDDSFSLRARWVVPVAGPPIDGGSIRIANGHIAEIGPALDGPCRDLGDVAILPGFVNAHTHLEFSDCEQPLPAGEHFGDWIKSLVAFRLREERDITVVVRQGLRESLRAGTTTLGEIASPRWPETVDSPQVDVTAFVELLGLASSRVDENVARAENHLQAAHSSNWRPGISPHAPYTVHPTLLAEAVRLAKQHNVPLAMHLAETQDELQLLGDGTGPLREMLEHFEAWEPDAIPPGTRVLDYLERLAPCPRSLVIHGNYLADDEIDFAARHRDRMSVVYCPRTHRHFGHPPHPLEKLLAAGAQVATGTDGRGSNPDLSLLEELRTIHQRHPSVAPDVILQLGTLGGAIALGRERDCGTLTVGKHADLAIVPVDSSAHDPIESILESDASAVMTFCRGKEF